jgi:hypothetical protein
LCSIVDVYHLVMLLVCLCASENRYVATLQVILRTSHRIRLWQKVVHDAIYILGPHMFYAYLQHAVDHTVSLDIDISNVRIGKAIIEVCS